jgi:hypothetical protein
MKIGGNRWRARATEILGGLLLGAAAVLGGMGQATEQNPPPAPPPAAAASPVSSGCMSCHTATDSASGHESTAVTISCVTCHGGNDGIRAPQGSSPGKSAYEKAKRQAHVLPKFPGRWRSSGNPELTVTLLQQESRKFVRFINPGDLRVAREACGTEKCHPREVRDVGTSMMRHGAMLWGSALYNNGAYPRKDAAFGELYDEKGRQAVARSRTAPSEEDRKRRGIMASLMPLARWEITQPGNVLRVFERGGLPVPELANPASGASPCGRRFAGLFGLHELPHRDRLRERAREHRGQNLVRHLSRRQRHNSRPARKLPGQIGV